jgi:hypothetical protein
LKDLQIEPAAFGFGRKSPHEGGQRSPRIPKALAVIVHQASEGKRPQPVWIETVKMYCFCTADLPIRAILAISEDVITAMGKRRSS